MTEAQVGELLWILGRLLFCAAGMTVFATFWTFIALFHYIRSDDD